MRRTIICIFLLLLFELHVYLVGTGIEALWDLGLEYFIRVPLVFFIMGWFSKKFRTSPSILYFWLGFIAIIGINFFFYDQEEAVLFKILFLSLGAACTYLISKYFLKEPAASLEKQGQKVNRQSGSSVWFLTRALVWVHAINNLINLYLNYAF